MQSTSDRPRSLGLDQYAQVFVDNDIDLEVTGSLSEQGLAMLRQGRGRRKQAHDLLAPICSWFTEGFDSKEPKAAKALLEGPGGR